MTEQDIKNILGIHPWAEAKQVLLLAVGLLIFGALTLWLGIPKGGESWSIFNVFAAFAILASGAFACLCFLAVLMGYVLGGCRGKGKTHDSLKAGLQSGEIQPDFYVSSRYLMKYQSLIFDKAHNTVWINGYYWPLNDFSKVRYRGNLIDLHFRSGNNPIQSVRARGSHNVSTNSSQAKQMIMNYMRWS